MPTNRKLQVAEAIGQIFVSLLMVFGPSFLIYEKYIEHQNDIYLTVPLLFLAGGIWLIIDGVRKLMNLA